VTLDSFEIWADGTQRFFGKADLSRFNEPFRVSQWGLSIIHVKSLLVGFPRVSIPTAMQQLGYEDTNGISRMPAYPSPFAGEPTEWVGRMGNNYKSFING